MRNWEISRLPILYSIRVGTVGSLEVRALDSRPEGLGSYTRCHQIPSEYPRSACSLNQWVWSFVTSAGTGEYFPPLQFPCRNCGGGDRGGVAIYRPFGNFAELNRTVTCMVLKTNDRRTSSPMPR
ncbi:hypothetical protein TNCV_1976641 [Trichonephila clavipes]|nr:hypothetical protein TNCV_1976641 [Trichonephila clavipes]